MKKLSSLFLAVILSVAFAENLKWEDADCRFEKSQARAKRTLN